MGSPAKETGPLPGPASSNIATAVNDNGTPNNNLLDPLEQGIDEAERHRRFIAEAEAEEKDALSRAQGFEGMGLPEYADLERLASARYHNDVEAERYELRFLDFWKRAGEWGAENLRWNREIFAELELTKAERIALVELADLVGEAWHLIREETWEDRATYFRWIISWAADLAKLLAIMLLDRGETPVDEAIAYIKDGDFRKNSHAAIILEREWKAYLLTSPAPTAENVIASLMDFYSNLTGALRSAGILKARPA